MQFLVEAIKKANSTDSDKVSKALLGLTIETPIGHRRSAKGPSGQPRSTVRQDRDGSEIPVPDHEARHLRRSHEVHGLIAIRAATLVQAAARFSRLAAQMPASRAVFGGYPRSAYPGSRTSRLAA
jgi:hypothetical protein